MILKLQQGGTSGGGMPPFADYTPVVLPYQDPFISTSKTESSSGSSNDLGLKDLLGMIKELDGLPNDSAALAKNLTSLFTDIAEAIRGKTGDAAGIAANDFPEAIAAIDTQEDLDSELTTQDDLIA
jgi:hypothetical protein